MSLQLVVTDAGRAALVNAANTGTLPVTIAQIGVTATAFTASADGSDTVLPGELKRLSTFAGAAVASDTIHVTLRDDGADVYSLRGFALYLTDGTLFGLYGQAGVILEKSALAMLLLSADIRFVQVDATSITFGDASFIHPPATTTVPGVVELATSAAASTGSDTQRAVTPSGLLHALNQRFGTGAPSAFVKSLLALTTAALFRTSLEIRTAALRDEGEGNGLDADKVDGQHGAFYLAWENQTGLPMTFPHDAHNHDASNINSGTLDDARIPALAIAKTTGLQGALDETYKSTGGDIGGSSAAPVGIKRVGATQVSAKFQHDGATKYFGLAANGEFRLGNSPNLEVGSTLFYHSGNFNPVLKLDVSAVNTSLASSTMMMNWPITSYPQGFSYGYTTDIARNIITMRHASDNRVLQILSHASGGSDVPGLEFRTSNSVGGWTTRFIIHHSGNFDPAQKANLASPALTGAPTAPTVAPDTNTTQLATTAFVQAAIAAALASYLTKNNPTFTGTMTGPEYNRT